MGMQPPFSDANGFYTFPDGSNIRTGTNPAYAVTDFTGFYPQFGNNSQGSPIISTTVIQQFINMATASIQQVRWRSAWQMAMGLFVAHYCTLYLQTYTSPDNGTGAVAEASTVQGVVTSHSVGDVSESMDVNVAAVEGWGNWNATPYGRQLANMAKVYGKGPMQIW